MPSWYTSTTTAATFGPAWWRPRSVPTGHPNARRPPRGAPVPGRHGMHPATKTRFEPTRIARDTYVIHDHQGEGTAPVSVALNSMVIRAAEPVVVDTGMAENRDQYLDDVFSIVAPEDI